MQPCVACAKECVLAFMTRLRAMNDADFLKASIVYHAAPTLMGLKPSTLICPSGGERDLERALADCIPDLEGRFDVKTALFRNHAGKVLLLVFQEALLRSCLADTGAASLLTEEGYDGKSGLDGMLETLRGKVATPRFPHEIGVFLGYPAADVRSFMADGGKKASSTGCWKAYGDERSARRVSDTYQRVKLRAAELLMRGGDPVAVVGELRRGVAA